MRFLTASFCAFIFAASAAHAAKPRTLRQMAFGDTADLVVHFSGARSDEGTMVISLFDRAEAFPNAAMKTAKTTIQNGEGTLTFKGLKPGTYAIAVAHDANNNGEMDKNGLGIPTEGFGFSNQAKVIFGPPKFAAACFPVGKNVTATNIEIRYF